MSKTVAQIFATNPTTVVADTDLYYLVQSPYTPGSDAAITGASLKAVFGSGGTVNPGLINQLAYYAASGSIVSGLATLANGALITSAGGVPSISQTLPNAVQDNITRLGTIASIGAPLGGAFGGTGVNNGASLIMIGGSVTFSGAFAFTGTLTGITGVTFPTSGTLATTSQLPTPSALTKVDDTNVTLTLGGTPATALLQAVSLTLGWVGQLGLTRGGTNASLTASNGGIVWSNATQLQILAGTATARQMLQSGATGSPAWSTATWPATTTANAVLFSSATNTVGEIASVASATLITSAGSVPSFSQTLPSAVQTNITALGAQSQALNMNTHQINNLTAGVAATDAANVGQVAAAASPLTTKGDLYTFTTVNARLPVGTINGQILQVNSGAATGLAWSTATFPSTGGTSGNVLISDGTNYISSTSLWPNTVGTSGKVVISNGTSNVYSTPTFPNASATTGKFIISDGTNWIASTPTIPNTAGTSGKILISDGTNFVSSTPTYPNASVTAGKFIISDGTNYIASTSIMPNTVGSAGTLIRSDGTVNAYTTSTYPNTNAINTLLYASAANVMSALATANNGVLVTDGSGVPTIGSQIKSANLPTGSMFNFQQTALTTTTSTTGAAYADIAGLSVAITPTSSSNTVLVRAVIQVGTPVTDDAFFQLVRGSTAIGNGATAGSRTSCNGVSFSSVATIATCVVLEFLDSPATTSATTYKVQCFANSGGTIQINRTSTDTNSSAFPRMTSTISVCEIKV